MHSHTHDYIHRFIHDIFDIAGQEVAAWSLCGPDMNSTSLNTNSFFTAHFFC